MIDIERLLVFDLVGSMAHFRKYYTNSSSLTYSFPPRTAITGLLAGVLGKPRDSYYDELSTANCCIGVAIKVPVRRIMQTANYVRTKKLSEVDGSAGPTQIPLEILVPARGASLRYRIYFAHQDQELMDELIDLVSQSKAYYPPYLGLAMFLGRLEMVAEVGARDLQLIAPGSAVSLDSVCCLEAVAYKGLEFKGKEGERLQYIKEKMPVEFDSNRYLKATASYLLEQNQHRLRVRMQVPVYTVSYRDGSGNDQEECISFLEPPSPARGSEQKST